MKFQIYLKTSPMRYQDSNPEGIDKVFSHFFRTTAQTRRNFSTFTSRAPTIDPTNIFKIFLIDN